MFQEDQINFTALKYRVEKKRDSIAYFEHLTLLNKSHIRQEKNCTSNSFIHQKFLNTYCDILNTFCRFLHAN